MPGMQVAEEVFTLSRVVRTFGTEKREGRRYQSWLQRLTHLSVRQATAYLLCAPPLLHLTPNFQQHPSPAKDNSTSIR